MKNLIKLFVIAAVVALTSFGLSATGADAKSGKCDAISYHGRDAKNNYTISGNTATIRFKVIGPKNCKVPVTIISWKSPSKTGAPFSKQTVYQKRTYTFSKGENHRFSIHLPNCYYQVDTITGTNIYGRTGQPHLYGSRMVGYKLGGTKSCNPPKTTPKPSAVCKSLMVDKLDRNSFMFSGQAAVANGATISGYAFNVYDNSGALVDTQTYNSTSTSVGGKYVADKAGSYTMKMVVKTSLGDKSAPSCEKPFTVAPEDKPGVSVIKLVDGVDYKKVGVNEQFTYQIKVTNTGNTDLNNVEVSDTPEAGVTLLSANQGDVANNTWSYSIPTLRQGESMSFTITAKVPTYKAGKIVNTVCVDAPTVPGTPDDCDDATVEVPPKTPETPVEQTPEALPQTGPADTLLKLFGAASLAGASAYYIASRRQ